jgi:hypothetical protein
VRVIFKAPLKGAGEGEKAVAPPEDLANALAAAAFDAALDALESARAGLPVDRFLGDEDVAPVPPPPALDLSPAMRPPPSSAPVPEPPPFAAEPARLPEVPEGGGWASLVNYVAGSTLLAIVGFLMLSDTFVGTTHDFLVVLLWSFGADVGGSTALGSGVSLIPGKLKGVGGKTAP